jgi:hypothetical protein
MATETYKWFIPEAGNLRADYGGAAILSGGDTAELAPSDLTTRHICRELGLPANATEDLFPYGTATDTNTYMRVPDNLYTAISSYLTTGEVSSAVSSEPAGWTRSSGRASLQPNPLRTNVILRGDSISAGVATTSGISDVYAALALNGVETLAFENNDREAENSTWKLINMSLGSSSWGNTNAGETDTYPEREDLAYNQRTRTLALDTGTCIFHYALGTNDMSYDTGLSAADAWARATTRLSALKTEFSGLIVCVSTCIKRTENTTLNGRIDSYNDLVRAGEGSNYDVLIDFEADISAMNISTGDTTNTTYYGADGIHPKTAGQALMAPVALAGYQAAAALL